jgi:hypothetical protein
MFVVLFHGFGIDASVLRSRGYEAPIQQFPTHLPGDSSRDYAGATAIFTRYREHLEHQFLQFSQGSSASGLPLVPGCAVWRLRLVPGSDADASPPGAMPIIGMCLGSGGHVPHGAQRRITSIPSLENGHQNADRR